MSTDTITNQELITVTLQFDESEDVISSRDLVLFLYYFRAVYVAFAPNNQIPLQKIIDQNDYYRTEARNFLAEFQRERQVFDNVEEDCGDYEMMITRITKSSPLEIVFTGTAIALVLAVIFSGGEIKLLGMKAKLPPLGKGIQELRKALAVNGKKTRSQQSNHPDRE